MTSSLSYDWTDKYVRSCSYCIHYWELMFQTHKVMLLNTVVVLLQQSDA